MTDNKDWKIPILVHMVQRKGTRLLLPPTNAQSLRSPGKVQHAIGKLPAEKFPSPLQLMAVWTAIAGKREWDELFLSFLFTKYLQ